MGQIVGIYTKGKDSNLKRKLESMMNCQVHRDRGTPLTLTKENIAIGMVNQHDTIFCESDTLCNSTLGTLNVRSNICAFVDGVVLDVPKHRKYFESIGYSIPIPACSAIIATAYDKWGIEFMNHLEGDFSCTVWDQKARTLILARDPYGHKPLHYYCDDNRFLFSSEIKGIIEGGVIPQIDLLSVSDFLSLNCIPYPATIFKNILQVPPGSVLIFDQHGIKIRRYWYPHITGDQPISINQAVLELNDAIRNAVKRRMITKDVYCFLSGGIDSSAVVSFASELLDRPIHVVSVGFAEEEANELDDAAVMAKHVGAEHHQVIAIPDSFFDMLDLMVYYHDSPFTDTSAYPTYYAAKLACDFTDIILTGDGPDQIMCGSDHHVFAAKHNLFSDRNKIIQRFLGYCASCVGQFVSDPTPTLFSKIRRKLYKDSLSSVHAAYDLRSYIPDIVKRFICTDDLWEYHVKNNPYRHPESWFKEVEELDDVNKYLFADMKFYLPDDLMVKVDRMCMAHGLETLSPFLDINISEIVNKLPGRYKLHNKNGAEISTKYVLKRVCQDRFPEGLLNKKKQGFEIPLEKWLKQDHGKYIREILLDPRTLNRYYFKKNSIKKLLDVFLDNRGDYFFLNPNGLVGLLTLELLHRRYID